MFRYLIESINYFLCFIKKRQIIKPKTIIVKVNIGSGLTVAQEWINIDVSLNAFVSKWPSFLLKMLYKISEAKQSYSYKEYRNILKKNFFVHHNIEYGIPFPDNSIDYIYMSHVIEHMFKEKAEKLLMDAHRTLKKSGLIRIGVPDLEYAISLYRKGNKEQALECFFPESKPNYYSYHRYMYDYDLLRQFLKKAGFLNIERRSYKQGKIPDIEILDNRSEDTLYVEANL